MKTLYFVDKNKTRHFIAQNEDMRYLYKSCFEDRVKKKIKSPYIRQWIQCGGLWIDYGSWSEFYFIEGATHDDVIKGEE